MIHVAIGNLRKTDAVRVGSLQVRDVLNARTTASFDLVDLTGAWRPAIGQRVTIELDNGSGALLDPWLVCTSVATLAAVSATSTAAALFASTDAAADTIGFTITPTDGAIYVGPAGVTAATGTPILKGSSLTVTTDNPAAWYVITDSGYTVNVRRTTMRGDATFGGRRVFRGSIDEFDEQLMDENTAARTYSVTAVSLDQIADKRLVARSYASRTAAYIVADIVTQDLASDGLLATTYVETGPTIDKVVFNYVTAAAALSELAELAAYSWWVDVWGHVHFASRASAVAPFSLTNSSGNYRRMRVNQTRADYRNRQYVRAGLNLTASRTDSAKGDGVTRAFVCTFPVGTVPTVTVNAVSKTVGIKGVDTGFDWYYSKGDATIVQDDGGTLLGTGDTLAVTYQGQYPILLLSQVDAEVTTRAAAEGGSGYYEAITDEPNIDDDAIATAKADALLRKFGTIPRTVEFETDSASLRAGHLLPIAITAHNLTGSWLVESVTMRDMGNGRTPRFTVKALSGEALGGWEAFFKALANRGRSFVIRDNEVIVLLRRTAETVTIADVCTPVQGSPESRADYATADGSEVG